MASVREIDKNDDMYVGVRFPLGYSQEGFCLRQKLYWNKLKLI